MKYKIISRGTTSDYFNMCNFRTCANVIVVYCLLKYENTNIGLQKQNQWHVKSESYRGRVKLLFKH